MRLRERFSLAGLLGAVVLTLLVPAAWAAEADLDGKARALDRGVPTEERAAFFTKFGIAPTGSNVAVYDGLPPGQALVLWSLCGDNTTCLNRAVADRQAHMGWGKVAEDLKARNLSTTDKVGQAVRQVTAAHRDLVAKDEKAKAERLEKAEKMQRMDRPEHPERPGR